MTRVTASAGSESPRGDWHQAWHSALETLELDVVEAERLLAVGRATSEAVDLPPLAGGWTPPALDGPPPGDLRARAEAILARQLRVAEDLARAMGSNRRQARIADRMDSGLVDRTQPVFIDSQF
jgi:hypothetical protein